MARSRGQIRKRGENKYLVRVYLGRVNGKRKYKSKVVHGSKSDAEKKLTQMLRRKDRGLTARPEGVLLEEFLDEWLEMKKSKIAATTYKNYERSIRLYIKPALGYMKLEDLHSRQIQSWINDMESEGLNPSYIQQNHMVLRSALQQAVVWEMLPYNPAEGGRVNLPKRQEREYRIFSKEEARDFLQATQGDRFQAMWALLLATGLRPQEVCALKWEDLDENGFLHVRRVVKHVGIDSRQLEVSNDMKTKKAKRRIKLPEYVLRLLDSYRADQASRMIALGPKYDRQGFIFDNGSGSFVDPAVVRENFKKSLEKAGLPEEIRLYDLRHTHISHLIINGVDLKKASHRAGHSSIKQTADTYAHLADEAEDEMVAATEQAFAMGGSG